MRNFKFRKLFVTTNYALKIAKEYYPKDKYNHAIRVCNYVHEMNVCGIISDEYVTNCLILAIMHDLLEDTDYTGAELPIYLYSSLNLLTKPKDMNYIDYIKRIKDSCCTPSGLCAWYVKLADMKDHLAQTETLTDRLKEKYLAAMPYLL